MKTADPTAPPPAAPPAPAPTAKTALPLRGWAVELARRWNTGTYSLFVLHGNIFDLFPAQEGERVSYVPLKPFLARRVFSERSGVLLYDIAGGLNFSSIELQKRFAEWL